MNAITPAFSTNTRPLRTRHQSVYDRRLHTNERDPLANRTPVPRPPRDIALACRGRKSGVSLKIDAERPDLETAHQFCGAVGPRLGLGTRARPAMGRLVLLSVGIHGRRALGRLGGF